jgi:hypothetical protein
MQNLYWKNSSGKTINLVNTPFENEEKFEAFIFKNQDLLENVFIFNRQIRSGHKQGIPDMLGIDQDGKICLIEMKNVTVTEEVLPQILQYAIWAETQPDSVKALWLEAKNRPEEIEINWDSIELRIIVIGPDFRGNVLRMSQRIGYAIELLKVTRFVSDKEEFILMEPLQEQPSRKITTTKAMENYDANYYEAEHGIEPTKDFMKAVDEIELFAKRKGWNLETKFNKNYVSFKYGNFIFFAVEWRGTKAWSVDIKLPEISFKDFDCEGWKYNRYESRWKQADIRKITPNSSISKLEAFFVRAYEFRHGKS